MSIEKNELKFTHLHVHSEYSLLDGSSKIEELVKKAKEHGMDSIALTDHGVMYGIIDFYKKAKENGIKPILGCEVYVAAKGRFCKESTRDNFYYHLILLAENDTGYQNIVKLVSKGFTEGFYYKPRIDKEILREHSEGIIALSACLAGPVAKNLLKTSYQNALAEALEFNEIFGQGNFFIELQDHGLAEQKKIMADLIKISEETNIPLVCTNDIHYVNEDDVKSHEILLCIQTNKTIHDEDRLIYEGGQFYLKSPEEMYKLFPYAIEGLENSYRIAQRCNVEIVFNEYKLPKFDVQEGETASEYLRKLTFQGLEKNYDVVTPQLKERLEMELKVIEDMGFIDYFLIVWDFIRYAKENDIIVGPGRGSAAGSIVAYTLGITNIDPIKYNLIFERFLNPERISMPDIDIDFCYERRQEVIDYVIEKYGKDRVAQIITFGTMAARAAIRDVGRALAMPYQEVDRIAKMIPFEIGITIEKALKINKDLNAQYNNEDNVRTLIDMSMRLEGLPRHSSTHAAGVVISNEPITEYVPLHQSDGVVTTQYTMTTLEELGLLKMDFLGLKTLTVIKNTVDEIKRLRNIDIDIDKIPFDDPKVFEMISLGKTDGVFQLESSGMKQFMKELKPESMEDIIAGISLYRPGPMDFIPKYVKGKNSDEEILYTHESLKPILEETYGCIVYQEQVMQIVRDLAGYDLGRSDLVRRAMSKKKASVMEEERKNFVYGIEGDVKGCLANGIPVKVAEEIFDEMTEFAKYAFNKSHAAAYAVIGYQTAWLKVHYPVEFMAALMTSVMGNNVKISFYINTCRSMDIEILPPDINKGFSKFSVDNGRIRYGLSSLKNVGKNTINALVKEREVGGEFRSLTDFLNRINSNDINKRALESLILAGAFDSLGGLRAQYMAIYPNILEGIQKNSKKVNTDQLSLFDLISEEKAFDITKDILPDIQEFEFRMKLDREKEVLGVYLTGHPLNEYMDILEKNTNIRSIDFYVNEEVLPGEPQHNVSENQNVVFGGLVVDVSVKYTRFGDKMAFITVEDLYGFIETVIFSRQYKAIEDRELQDAVIIIKGKTSVKEDEDAKLICNEIIFADDLKADPLETKEVLWIKIENSKYQKKLLEILKQHKGHTSVIIYNKERNEKSKLKSNFNVDINDLLLEELETLLDKSSIIIR